MHFSKYHSTPERGGAAVLFFVVVLILSLCIIGGSFLIKKYYLSGKDGKLTIFRSFNSQSNINQNAQDRKIIILQKSEATVDPIFGRVKYTRRNAFFTYEPETRQKKEILKLPNDIMLTEAQVSPDGKKFYYIVNLDPSKPSHFPTGVTIVNNDGSKKEYNFTETGLGQLLAAGQDISGSGKTTCFWSSSSIKLACIYAEKENSQTAGTDFYKVAVLNLNNGEISRVFKGGQIVPPVGERRIVTILAGWVNNDKLLIVQIKDNFGSEIPELPHFNVIDTKTKAVNEEFSYHYYPSSDIAIDSQGSQIFFGSTDRGDTGNNPNFRLVSYNLKNRQPTVLNQLKSYSDIDKLLINEGGTKLIYDLTDQFIHIYDLSTRQEQTQEKVKPLNRLKGMLSANKLIFEQKPYHEVIFDSQTQKIEDLGGIFIGTGYF